MFEQGCPTRNHIHNQRATIGRATLTPHRAPALLDDILLCSALCSTAPSAALGSTALGGTPIEQHASAQPTSDDRALEHPAFAEHAFTKESGAEPRRLPHRRS